MARLKLYHGDPVSNSLKCLIALGEKQLAFDGVFVDLLRFEQHDPAFLAINPDGLVPVLDHDGTIVTESSVISEYLEDAFPDTPPLRPADPAGRARMRQWNAFIDQDVWSHVSLHGFNLGMGAMLRDRFDEREMDAVIARIPLVERQRKWRGAWHGYAAADLDHARRKVEQAVERADRRLTASDWLVGSYTLADINLFADLGLGLGRLFPDLAAPDRYPGLHRWIERMKRRPAVEAALATAVSRRSHR